MAARYVQGVQSHPVISTAKHYNVNAQEENRLQVDARLDERTLQEIYTLPFEAAVKDGHIGAVMGAYNKINGTYCCENRHVLTEILKEQLDFAGWVVSDFQATHSTVEAANAGLDLELDVPPAKYFGTRLLEAIQAGQVSLATIDDKVCRILRSMFAFGLFDYPVQITPLPEQEHGQPAREIAGKGIVLLKNTGGLLPLSSHKLRSLAVIGADADCYIAGGGSALVQAMYLVSILEGMRRRAAEDARVEYAEGTDPLSAADLLPGPPLVPSSVLTPSESASQARGLQAEYWTNARFEGEPGLVRIERQVGLNLRLFLDGQLLIDDPGLTLRIESVTRHLVAGEHHALRIEYAADRPEQGAVSSFALIGAKVRFGWEHPSSVIPLPMQEAAELARKSDVAIVVVRDYNSEHADRPSLTLPNEQDLLVQTVVAANPRTIVVVASGGPVLMPWLDQVPAVLECWYGGQEVGNALADVLFGDITPSGKLPVTFPRSDRDTPVSEPSQYSRTELVAHFSEGLGVGYRGYDQFGIEPLFPFGYGLSYTNFAYAQLQVEPETTDGTRNVQVSFTVTNTGSRAGAEIAQVYLGLPASIGEPPQRLVGWAKVELEPGESKEVSVTLDPNATSRPLSYWNVNTNGWEVAGGDYQVYVGASSRDIRLTGFFRVDQAEKQ